MKILFLVLFNVLSFFILALDNILIKQLPYEHDWRTISPQCFDKVRVINQEKCRAGYAISGVEMIEIRQCIQNQFENAIKPLSSQEIISCDENNFRCNGGSPFIALEYISKNGLVSEECFPLSSQGGNPPQCFNKTSECARNKFFPEFTIHTFNKDGPIMQEILFNGPVIATFDLYNDLYDYTHGIYQKREESEYIGKHSVLLVGYNRKGKEEYWIGMNSFGPKWGENGFFQMPFHYLGIDEYVVSIDLKNKK